MNKPQKLWFMGIILAVATILGGSDQVLAQPVASNSSAVLTTSGLNDISMFLVPDGTGTPFTSCFQRGGALSNAVITVTLRDVFGAPVSGVPASLIRLEQASSPLAWCTTSLFPPPPHGPNKADGPTDMLGETTFTRRYFGGSWVEAAVTGGTYVWLLDASSGTWNQIPTSVLVSYNSPDLNGDLVVDLLDVSEFAMTLFGGAYHYKIDFNYDLFNNLIDFAMFVPEYGASCP